MGREGGKTKSSPTGLSQNGHRVRVISARARARTHTHVLHYAYADAMHASMHARHANRHARMLHINNLEPAW